MRVDELRALLERVGARPLKARGQHFLLDDAVVARAVAASGVAAGERVLEIGPGPGILTAALLGAGASVAAVELDVKMVHLLEERFAERDFRVTHGDILRADINAVLADASPTPSSSPTTAPPRYRIVANIPYNITSPILERFLDGDAPRPASLTLMVQKEVADRILAKRGDMNALAVFVRAFGHVERVMNVPAGAFYPPPKVDSSVIHIVHKSEDELRATFGTAGKERFFRLVRAAFQGKRKQLGNSLRAVVPDRTLLEKGLSSANIPATERPENLDLDDWRRLADALP